MSARSNRKNARKNRRKRQAPQAPPGGSYAVGASQLPGASLDSGGDDRQDGEAGRSPDSAEHSGHREDGGSGARPIARVSAQPTDPSGHQREEIARPYEYHEALDLPSAVRFIDWIRRQAGETLGYTISNNTRGSLGIASQDEGWWATLDSYTPTGSVIQANLLPFLRSPEAPQLIVPDSSVFNTFDLLLAGDLALLRKATGRLPPPAPSWPSPADEAYDAITTHAHWVKGAPAFYKQVAIPRARQKIAAEFDDSEGTPWRIVYTDLLLRVIAHYTREPTLVAAFNDDVDPLPHVAQMLELEDAETAYAAVLWTALGWDSAFLDSHYPRLFSRLSDGLTAIRGKCERRLAVIVMSTIQQREDYIRNREAYTLYGQRIPWNLSVAEMIEQRYRMTAEEILDVVCVSFAKDEPLTVGPADEDLAERSIRIRGKARGLREEWQPVLEDVGGLGGVLSVPLGAQVIWDP